MGYAYPGQGNCYLMSELSSIFLNYKDMFTKDTRNSQLALVNKLLFFFSYTILRVIFFPYNQVIGFKTLVFVWSRLSLTAKLCGIYTNIQGFAILCLNMYWYWFILKVLYRTFAGTDKKDDDEGKEDKKKDDGLAANAD